MRVHTIAATWVLFVALTPALAADYSDPSGYSFTYPDGWFAVAGSNVDSGKFPPEIQTWLKKNNVNLNQVSVIVLRPGQDDFIENANVVVERQQIPADGASAKKLSDMLTQQYRTMGATVKSMQARVQKIGEREAIILDIQVNFPGSSLLVQQRQVAFPGGGNTYIVTCTGKADTFAAHAPAFDAMLASFKVPAPIARTFDWNQVLITLAIGGVVGAVCGGLGRILMIFTGGKKPSATIEGQSDS